MPEVAEDLKNGVIAKHVDDCHKDDGEVLWWTKPVDVAPYVGSPLCGDWPGYHQWWTPLPPIPTNLVESD